jgi:hypothetical protein
MWLRNEYSRNLGIILVVLIILLILNNILFLKILIEKNKETQVIKRANSNGILFKSINEKIKEHAIYFFLVFCILIFIFSITQNG